MALRPGDFDPERAKAALQKRTAVSPADEPRGRSLVTNDRRRLLAVYLIAIMTACLFPPWVVGVNTANVRYSSPVEYRFIGDPPHTSVAGYESASVDVARLILTVMALSAVAGVVALWLGKPVPPTNEKTMNWKRGLFRVWVFLSAVWLIGAGSTAVLESSSIEHLPREPTAQELAACKSNGEVAPDSSSYGTRLDTSGLTPLAERSADDEWWKSAPLGDSEPTEPALLTAEASDPGRLLTDAEVFGVAPICAGYRPLVPVRVWKAPEWWAMGTIVGAPLLVLGFALVVAWIVAGFRDRSVT